MVEGEIEKVTIVRYSEIALKGKNRGVFEKYLIDNIKNRLETEGISYVSVKRVSGRLFVRAKNDLSLLKYIFGIHSISQALEVKPTIENIQFAANEVINSSSIDKKEIKSFRITAKRSDKSVKLRSREIGNIVGDYINIKYGWDVSMNDFDLNIGVEIIEGKAYVYVRKEPGFLGLPMGSEGKVLLLTDQKNYELAAWYMMKRGCEVSFFGNRKPEFLFLKKFRNKSGFDFYSSNDYSMVEVIEMSKAYSVVSGDDSYDFIDLRQRTNKDIFILAPLVGFSNEQVDEKIKLLSET